MEPVVARTAELRAAGVSDRALAGPGWSAPVRGVHVAAGSGWSDVQPRIAAAALLVPPTAALGGWAAAHLHGVEELDGRGTTGRGALPVPIVLPPPRRIRRQRGVLLVRSALPPDELTEAGGIPVTTLVRTAFDCARAAGRAEALVAVDLLVGRGGLDVEDLRRLTDDKRGWRGIDDARWASAYADGRSLSPGESRLRALWLHDAGLPRPEVNVPVHHRDGHLLGVVDLLDPVAGLVGEYDGAGHRDEQQHADDNAREEWLEAAGLVVARFGGRDLAAQRGRSVARLLAAYARGMGRDRRRDRWTWRSAP